MKKVVLALSGGVDSAVAAVLLQRQGFAVHGLNLQTWAEDHHRENISDLAKKLNFPVDFLDVRQTFREQVVQPFIDAYSSGLTPSPCVFCNRQIKWSEILRKADQIGAEFVATGHYARLRQAEDGLTQIWKAADSAKDQSYMLTFLTQPLLSRTLLPLGGHTKPQIRQIAADLDLAVSDQPDSQDLCFLACGDYRNFLRQHSDQAILPGPIVNKDGELLGQHEGLAFYTIGQRKGLPSATQALYVVEKRSSDNSLIVGFLQDLGADKFLVRQVNWISGKPLPDHSLIEVKIRYHSTPVKATIMLQPQSSVLVTASDLLRDITPGQIAAFYQGEQLIGGGVIQEVVAD
ncbi:MAG: tRNA 2-thiouridine(34) synthase MnmA [Anaerolineaceae bacterium]|nr:tRNA 2-thiouridine(34) synthase MnmA [Anaerolineaceae bacterium]